ncbi:MAG: hypothetical protein ACLTDR_07290 [Adlercreutzia equolifaciens]
MTWTPWCDGEDAYIGGILAHRDGRHPLGRLGLLPAALSLSAKVQDEMASVGPQRSPLALVACAVW